MNKENISWRKGNWLPPSRGMTEAEVDCYLSVEVGDELVMEQGGERVKVDYVKDHDYFGNCTILSESPYDWETVYKTDWKATAELHGFMAEPSPKVVEKVVEKPAVKPVVKPIIVGDATFFVNVYMDSQGRLCTPGGPLHTSMAEAKKYGKKGVDNSGWVYINSYPVNIKAKGKK